MTHWRLRWCQSSVHPWHPLHLNRSFTSVQVLHTHTPGRNWVNPERQEEKKNGHQRRANGQNSAGGEGNKRTSRTNLHGETDPTSTEHTPKPHDTLQRGTGQIRDRMGDWLMKRSETAKKINGIQFLEKVSRALLA